MSKEIIVYSPDIPSGVISKNLWNDDSVHILLTEYKKLKDAYSIRRSSSMPKKGWEAIKKKLHSAGYTDIRHQHVVKKFAALKLHYKELREGLPVKQRVYGFVDLLSEILDDDPYIAFAKPTKRMKEKRLCERKEQKHVEQMENYITLEFTDLQSDEKVTEIIHTSEMGTVEGGQFIDASILLNEHPTENHQIEESSKKQKKISKGKKEIVLSDNDKPGMPSWISYLVELLRKEEQQKTDRLWRLHEDICQAEKVKVDILERLISCFSNTSNNEAAAEKPIINHINRSISELVIPESKIIVPDSKTSTRNIIIVDEEGSIYLKPSDILKRKGEPVEYALAHKILKPQPEMEFLEADSIVEAPQFQLQLIGDGDEIIIENCEGSEIYKVEPDYEEENESNVISHVEIIEEQVEVEEGALVEHHIDAIEFIQHDNQ